MLKVHMFYDPIDKKIRKAFTISDLVIDENDIITCKIDGKDRVIPLRNLFTNSTRVVGFNENLSVLKVNTTPLENPLGDQNVEVYYTGPVEWLIKFENNGILATHVTDVNELKHVITSKKALVFLCTHSDYSMFISEANRIPERESKSIVWKITADGFPQGSSYNTGLYLILNSAFAQFNFLTAVSRACRAVEIFEISSVAIPGNPCTAVQFGAPAGAFGISSNERAGVTEYINTLSLVIKIPEGCGVAYPTWGASFCEPVRPRFRYNKFITLR